MSTTATKYGVLVCVDGSEASDAAVAWATHEAAMRKMPLTIMHAAEPVVVGWPAGRLHASMPEWQRDHVDVVIAQAREAYDTAAKDCTAVEPEWEVLYARTVPTLIDASKDAWMIVVGSQGMGALGRLLLGSVTTSLLHHAHCPVVVIHCAPRSSITIDRPVLLGIDGSPASEAATALAFDEASRRASGLVALHAWSDVGMFPILGMDWHERKDQGQEILSERLAGWRDQYPEVVVTQQLVCDQPARWLIKESASAQLVVLGSRGRGGFSGLLLGSVSSTVAQLTTTPLVVVRSE